MEVPVSTKVIETMAGVTATDERAGRIELRHNAGDMVVDLVVIDGEGSQVIVHLGYDALVDLVVKGGSVAVQL